MRIDQYYGALEANEQDSKASCQAFEAASKRPKPRAEK